MKRAAKEQSDDDWRWLGSSVQGRRIVRELLTMGGLLQSSMSDNPLRSAFAEGRRSMASDIYVRLTNVIETGDVPALLAEVLSPNVRNDRASSNGSDPGRE